MSNLAPNSNKSVSSTHFTSLQGLVQLWTSLAGAAAGIGILLSALGFLLLRTHANMLGISSVLHHSIVDYLYEGSVFFIATVFWALPTAMVTNRYGWLFIASLVLIFFKSHLARTSKTFTATAKWVDFQRVFEKQWFRWTLSIFILCLLPILTYLSLPNFDAYDLLFSPVNHTQVTNRSNKVSAKTLEDYYIFSVMIAAFSILLFIYICNMADSLSKNNLINTFRVLPFFFVISQIFFLPMNYALNVMPNEFHRVSKILFNKENDIQMSCCKRIWLLNEQSSGYILYDGNTKEIFILHKENVINLGLKKRENIFAREVE